MSLSKMPPGTAKRLALGLVWTNMGRIPDRGMETRIHSIRRCFCSVLVFLLPLVGAAQIQRAWVARYNNGITNGTNQALKMALDSAGNIYVTGFSENTNNNTGYVTVKYAPNGSQLWAARYDSTNVSLAQPKSFVLDASNNTIVTGNAGTVKFDGGGNLLWALPSYGGVSVATDTNANVFVAGFSNGFNTAKLTPSGTNLWTRAFTDEGPMLSESVIVDTNGNAYVCGLDTWLVNALYKWVGPRFIKYDGNGNLLWKYIYQPFSIGLVANGAAIGSDGYYYGVVDLISGVQAPDAYTAVKFSLDGNPVWVAGDNPTHNADSQSHGFCLDILHNVCMTGQNDYEADPNSSCGTFKVGHERQYALERQLSAGAALSHHSQRGDIDCR